MTVENPENMAESPESEPSEKSKPSEVCNDDTSSETGGESRAKEVGGRDGPDPTRFGDWEKNGRCIDF